MVIQIGGWRKVKHGKRLTVKEKIKLKELGYEPECYLRTKKFNDGIEVVNTVTGIVQDIRWWLYEW